MPIELSAGPAAGLEIIKTHLSTTNPEPVPFLAFQSQLQNGQLVAADDPILPTEPASVALLAADPYPVYTVPFSITVEAVLNPKLTAWQYLLVKPDHSIHALVELAVLPDGSVSFAELYPREYAEWLAGTINPALDVLDDHEAQYNLRLLRAPSLSFQGFWLHHATDRSRDRIVAVGDGEPNYRHGQVMPEATVLQLLGEISASRLPNAGKFQFR
ncbi:MAG: hypothetical protein JOZ54_02085 [Acidobacteria bacterium]|nr:hypothetical protein [Acidobacteriota bacterium]